MVSRMASAPAATVAMVMSMMVMVVMMTMVSMLTTISRAIPTILHLMLNHIRNDGSTNRTQQSMFLLVPKVITCCTTGKRTS